MRQGLSQLSAKESNKYLGAVHTKLWLTKKEKKMKAFRKSFSLIIMGLLIAVLAACGQTPESAVPVPEETLESQRLAYPAKIIGYTLAHNRSASLNTDYNPIAQWSYNSTGQAITIRRYATGYYRVKFLGQNVSDSNVQVTATTDSGHTRNECVFSGLISNGAYVRCYNSLGQASNSQFFISIRKADQATGANTIAYAFANNRSSSSYTPWSSYRYNSAGGAITASRQGQGRYIMTFNGLDSWGTTIHVTARDTNRYCTVMNLGSGTANVSCFGPNGFQDSRYTVEVIKNKSSNAQSLAYARAPYPVNASYTVPTIFSYNSTGGAVTAVRTGVGRYRIRFAGQSMSRGNVQVTPVAGPSNAVFGGYKQCNLAGWGGENAWVRCYDDDGNPADAAYSLEFTTYVHPLLQPIVPPVGRP